MSKIPLVEVSPAEIRKLFNDGHYVSQVQAGELAEKLLREAHPSPPRSHQPPCTRSQILAYLDAKGHAVAIVHQYVRPDGKLGGSGQPDPKKLFKDGQLFVAR